MGHFTFRLVTLLLMRKNRRDACRAQLAQADHADELLGRRQEELDRQRDELLARCRQAAGPGEVHLDRLIEYRRYDRLITMQQDELKQERQQAGFEIDGRRKTLVAADREVRVLEKLEGKQRDEHRERDQRCETRMLDEIATIQHAG